MSLTSVIDGRTHLVTDVELARPEAMNTGRYSAVCGHLVAPAPLIEPNGERCTRCAEPRRNARPAADGGR